MEALCPWCGSDATVAQRMHDDHGTQYGCTDCGMRFVIRPGDSEAYCFWVPDVQAAFDSNAEPLEL